MSTLVTAHDLARDIDDFLRFKHAMGMQYWRGEFVLNAFRRFIAPSPGLKTSSITTRPAFPSRSITHCSGTSDAPGR